MDGNYAMLHDILGFKGKKTGRYYLGIVMGISYNDDSQRCVDVQFWMPKAKQLDPRVVPLADLNQVDLIGSLPGWVEWDV